MRTESHVGIARATVRAGELPRHAAVKLETGRTFVMTGALALPRLWGVATAASLEGFTRGLEQTAGQKPEQRLEKALHEARVALAARCDMLVERMLPDSTLLALVLDQGALHVLGAGAVRAYVQRAGNPMRLLPRDEPQTGILKCQPVRSSMPLEPGDLVLGGSASAFSTKGIAKLAEVLQADPRTPPSVLASLLLDPAGQAGTGGAVIVLRVA